MNQLHRDWLRENHTKLVNNIESIEVADILYSKDCLSQDDVERIQKAVTHKDKARVLLQNLPLRHRNGLQELFNALRETTPWLLDELAPFPAEAEKKANCQPIQTVDNKVFMRLTRESGVCENWKHVGRSLGLSDMDITVIDNENGANIRECTHQMLVKWKSKSGRKATAEVLVAALRENELIAIADDLEGL